MPGELSLSDLEILASQKPTPPEALSFLKEKLEDDTRSGAGLLIRKFERRTKTLEKETSRLEKLWAPEKEAAASGAKRIAGVDEAGRGPLVGAVVTAAVILPEGWTAWGLNDSKKLTAEKREALFTAITRDALAWGVGIAQAEEIDRLNIYKATQAAMGKAVRSLEPEPDFLLTDAMPLPDLGHLRQKALVHGDALSASIAAASIVAKVTRDRMMEELDRQYPLYGFSAHKGYGTEAHLRALREHGPCPEHRVSFGPVLEALMARVDHGPEDYWKSRLAKSQNRMELEQVGHQIKRLGAAGLKPSALEALREAYRLRMTDLRDGQ
ncbi:MAG: ribonuclease HII [bacterium]